MIHCGASGWMRPDWAGVVYPRLKPRGFHPLEYLAHCVDLVEVEGPLRPELVRLWLSRISHNRQFTFTVVLDRAFTHERTLDAGAIRQFNDALWPLGHAGRLGAVLMRFPWSFRFTRENRDFLIELRRTFHEFPLAAELRHASWTLDEALGTLMDYRIGFCNVDQPAGARALRPSSIVTSPVGYVRLLGRAGGDWTDEEAAADYLYAPPELGEWQRHIERLAAHTTATFVVAANSVAGKSVINAMQLRAMLREATTAPPQRETSSGPARLPGRAA